jgi:hypothetical protein
MRYIKVITAFPEVDEYDSFMGAEYHGEWLGRTNMNSSPSGKGTASSESDDDEYDSFLGG